jgi:hypothetical protein
MMDHDRVEKITAPDGAAQDLDEEEARLRDAWLALTNALGNAPNGAPSLDPDDVYAELMSRERRRAKSNRRTAVVCAASLIIAVVVGVFAWNRGPAEERIGGNDVAMVPIPAWDDDWEASAREVERELLANAESLRYETRVAWIDRELDFLFVECVRVWTTL